MQPKFNDLDKKLMEALEYFEWNEVKLLLKEGADIHIRDDFAIYQAVWQRNEEMALYLLHSPELKEHAHFNVTQLVPMCFNFRELFIPLLEKLIDKGLDIKQQQEVLLINAIEKKNIYAVKLLHKLGTDLTAKENLPLITAFNHDTYHILDYLFENGVDKHFQNEKLLKESVLKKNLIMGDFLIQKGLSLDKAKENKEKEIQLKCNSMFKIEDELVMIFNQNDTVTKNKEKKFLFLQTKIKKEIMETNNAFDTFTKQHTLLQNSHLKLQPEKGYFPITNQLYAYTIKFLKENNIPYHLEDYSALQLLIKNKQFRLADYMLSSGMDINYDKSSFLTSAIQEDDIEIISYLSQKGANFKLAAENLPNKKEQILQYEMFYNLENKVQNKKNINKKKI